MHDEAYPPESPPPAGNGGAGTTPGVEDELRPLTVTVGEQVIRVRVSASDEARYRRAAARADAVLKDILGSGVVGGARALAMVSIELAAELDEARALLRQAREDRARIDRLTRWLEGVLERAGAANADKG